MMNMTMFLDLAQSVKSYLVPYLLHRGSKNSQNACGASFMLSSLFHSHSNENIVLVEFVLAIRIRTSSL